MTFLSNEKVIILNVFTPKKFNTKTVKIRPSLLGMNYYGLDGVKTPSVFRSNHVGLDWEQSCN